MQDSDHTYILRLNFGPFYTMIGQIDWEKIDLIRSLKHLAVMFIILKIDIT